MAAPHRLIAGHWGKLGRRPGHLLALAGKPQLCALEILDAARHAARNLLADEPTGNLDSSTGRAILDLLSELNESRRMTIVLVTHHAFGATYGHRTIELADGRIVHDVETPPRTRLHLVSEESS